jgi:hypothetical protein
MKIDFGCGPEKKSGYLGVDVCAFDDVDIVYAEESGIPLPDNSVDEVYSRHTLEHVNSIFLVMKELHRICVDGAVIRLCLPHFSAASYHWNFDHKRTFGLMSFEYIYGKQPRESLGPHSQGVVLWQKDVRLEWWDIDVVNSKTPTKRIILRVLNWIINKSANFSLFFCERIWCRYVGGFDNIYYTLIVVKKDIS